MAGKYVLSRQARSPIFIITTRRSGSNFLLSALNSIPGASFAEEILNKNMVYGLRDRFISKKSVLRHIQHSVNYCGSELCGAKLLKIQMEQRNISLEDLKALYPSCRFIILYRKSLLDQFISLKIAESTGTWLWYGGDNFKPPVSLRIEKEEFLHYSADIRRFYDDLFKLSWVRERSLILSYEELYGDIQRVFDERVFSFLGIPKVQIAAKTCKQNTRMPHEIIENYGEVSSWVELGDAA